MKVLVTGGAGFIGSHVVDAFLTAGHEVCVVDDLSSGYRKNIASGATFYEVDIRNEGLDEVFQIEKPDIVSHQAARANVRESFEKPLLYADVNVLGSLNLLECCRRHEVNKVIYACTGGAAYGQPLKLPVPEDHPINPLDPYGASKHHVEHFLYLYRANFGISYVSLRYPNVYGPRQDPNGEAGVVAIFTGQLLKGQRPVINGAGDQERDFVHVSDVARANLLALDKGDGEILNIGSGVGTSINTIFSTLASQLDYGEEADHGAAKKGEVYKIYLDPRRAFDVLGWTSKITLSKGLASTVDYFRSSFTAD